MKYKKLYSILFVSVLLLGAAYVYAEDSVAVLAADQTINDNYVKVAEVVRVLGRVEKDVIVVGNDIEISGTVGGDILAVGSNVVISGSVEGNVRVVGNVVKIDSIVKKNLTVAGKAVTIGPKGSVGWSTVFYGDTLNVDGALLGRLDGWANKVAVAGTIKDNAQLGVGEGGLTLASTANVESKLTYTASQKAKVAQGAKATALDYKPLLRKTSSQPSWFWWVVFLFGAWIVGSFLVLTKEEWLKNLVERTQANPGKTALWGVIATIIIPVISLILLITYIGIPLALISLSLYGVALYLAKIIGGLLIGVYLFNWWGKKVSTYVLMLVGILIYKVVIGLSVSFGLIWLSLIVWAVAVVFALGAIAQSFWAKEKV